MKALLSSLPICLLVCISLTSCDSNQLVQKREEQQLEISRLRGELKLIDEKLKNLPPDRSKELAAAKEEANKQISEISRLEEEIADLENRKKTLDTEFDAYRAKYTLQ